MESTRKGRSSKPCKRRRRRRKGPSLLHKFAPVNTGGKKKQKMYDELLSPLPPQFTGELLPLSSHPSNPMYRSVFCVASTKRRGTKRILEHSSLPSTHAPPPFCSDTVACGQAEAERNKRTISHFVERTAALQKNSHLLMVVYSLLVFLISEETEATAITLAVLGPSPQAKKEEEKVDSSSSP